MSALKKTNLQKTKISEGVIFIVFLLLSVFFIFLINLPWSPRYYSMSIDNGIFAYGGKLITQGQIPYLDYWDNIPPVINYINALTFRLFSPTPWAVWWLNIIWLSLTTVLTCNFVRKLSGLVPSILAGVLLILLVMDGNLFSGGDMTEFFSLIPQVLALWALYKYWQFKQPRWVAILGLLTTLAFLTKQTAIGLGVSSILVIVGINLLDQTWQKALRAGILYMVSVLSSLLLVLSYWQINGGVQDFLDQVIIFNFSYTHGGISVHQILLVLKTMATERPFMFLAPLVIISYLHLIIAYVKKATNRYTHKQEGSDTLSTPSNPTYLSAFLGLPIVTLLIATSIYNYSHYYTLIIPSVIFILVYLLENIIKQMKTEIDNTGTYILALLFFFFGSIWLIDSIRSEFPKSDSLSSLQYSLYGNYPLDELERYIVDHTNSQDTLLVWDMHTEIYFRTGLNSPSRFIHPIPLLSASGKIVSNFDLFMDDLASNPPEFIIAQEFSPSGVPFFDVPDERICPTCLPEVQSGLRALREYVYAHYSFDRNINNWIIYRQIQ
jgi:4-amino-4-deoxy-L-arabinose transferase-like glycosyltransferase